MRLRNISLEMSLKPFYEVSDAFIESVCREAFTQWLPLLRDADQVSVLLWTADGSEILDYKGDLNAEIEWARYIGSANPHWTVPGDPEKKSIHAKCRLYRENPAVITYATLRKIVATLKRVGRQVTGLPVRVGETFDPGCEFAVSPWKYKLHRETCMADTGGPKSFMCCYAVMNGDKEEYAGYPNGVPEGTKLGEFFGRQCQHMLTDMGFDYVWFSNGFGFGLETWMTRGPLFDGRRFDATRAREIGAKIVEFWQLFRKECPTLAVETRGTNLGTGIDLASDAVPLREIYRGNFNMQPPPNSPWAALNSDFGLELAGWMSHIAELPPNGSYPFRFYTHDPWWHNSPWLDRYAREPHDIYMPMAVSRVDAQGIVRNPDAILFLSIDDSYGQLPVQVPNEVIPHLQDGMRNAPDRPGPVVWVYPFNELHDRTFSNDPRLDEAFFADWFIRSAIGSGTPINTVVSTDNLVAALGVNPAAFAESVLLAPVPDAQSPLSAALIKFVQTGGRVLLYGPLRRASAELRKLLGLNLDKPLDGDTRLDLRRNLDPIAQTPYPTLLNHRPLLSAGGLEETAAADLAPADIIAACEHPAGKRILAVSRKQANGGSVAWVRGSSAYEFKGGDIISGRGHLPTADPADQFFHGDILLRHALADLGFSIAFARRDAAQRTPVLTIHRSDNAFYFSGFVPDMTVETRLRLPAGAPIFRGYDAQIIDGAAAYRLARAFFRECRIFVEQATGTVSTIERCAELPGLTRRIRVPGCQNATVRVYPPHNAKDVIITVNATYPFFEGPFVKYETCHDTTGRYLLCRNITGELMASW